MKPTDSVVFSGISGTPPHDNQVGRRSFRAWQPTAFPSALSSLQAPEIIQFLLQISQQSPGFRQWCLELSKEKSPELFFTGLWNLGLAWEKNLSPQKASEVYNLLLQTLPADGQAWADALRKKIGRQQSSLRGEGPFALRLEDLSRQFIQETTRPLPVLAFGAASLTYRSARLFGLSRLAASPSANFLTRGFGLKACAGLGGMAAESLVFPLILHGAENPGPFIRNWGQSALFLGSIRLSGFAAQTLGRKALLAGPVAQHLPFHGSLTRSTLEFIGTYSGILLAQHLEQSLNLRSEASSPWLSGLATYLQLRVGQQWAEGFWGRNGSPWEKRFEAVETRFGPPNGNEGRAFAWAGGIGARPNSAKDPRTPVLMMAAKEPGEGGLTRSEFFAKAQRESQFRRGSVRIEIRSEKEFTDAEWGRRLQILDDGFCSLLFGYTTKGSGKLEGPIAELLQTKKSLAMDLVKHLEKTGHRVIAQVDFDTKILERVIALNADGIVAFSLDPMTGLVADEASRTPSPAIPPPPPRRSSKPPKIPSPPLLPTIKPVANRSQRPASFQDPLREMATRLEMKKPSPRPGDSNPVQVAAPLLQKVTELLEILSRFGGPKAPTESEAYTWFDLLKTDSRRLLRIEFQPIASEAVAYVPHFFQFPKAGIPLLEMWLNKADTPIRLDMCQKIADFLASSHPPHRAIAFALLRDSLDGFEGYELSTLRRYIEQRFPKEKYSAGDRYMVRQVLVQIDERTAGK